MYKHPYIIIVFRKNIAPYPDWVIISLLAKECMWNQVVNKGELISKCDQNNKDNIAVLGYVLVPKGAMLSSRILFF